MIWRPIPLPFVANRFQACDEGVIRTDDYETEPFYGRAGLLITRQVKGRVLKQRIVPGSPSRGKHPVVAIYSGHGRSGYRARQMRVARLVAAAFIGVPYDAKDQRQVQQWRLRYLDGDVTNCHVLNLEWVHNAGQDGSEGATQARYERHLDEWRNREDAGSVLARLYEGVAA